ncbi:MAG: helix-turn-helix domain-containing protein [Alphaproteobacteria bacterium]
MISAAQIRAGRALINAKQSELAKAAGVALATLNNIERGVGDPRSSTLEAIERALAFAGVECDGDGQRETVSLQRLSRPSAHDTYFACQRVLECLEPGSLLKVERVRFYVQSNQGLQQTETPRRIAVMIEGESRSVLFDQASFSLTDSVRVAEVARMLTAALVNCPDGVDYTDTVVEDTTVAHLEEAAYRLAALDWQRLTHPKQLLQVYGEWTSDLQRLADTREHPLHEAFSCAGSPAPETAAPFAPPDLPHDGPENDEATEPDSAASSPVEETKPASQPASPPTVHRALSPEEVARLLGEPDIAEVEGEDDIDDGPPLPDLSGPAADVGDPPPLPDPSAPNHAAQEIPEAPPLPDPSAPENALDIDDVIDNDDDEDDPLLTTPPPAFKT